VQNGGAELTHQIIEDLGHAPPNEVTACIVGVNGCVGTANHRHLIEWVDSNLDSPDGFRVFRTRGTTVNSASVITPLTPGAALPPSAAKFEDPEELPNGVAFTYWTKAVFGEDDTNPSVQAHIAAAVNVAPVAIDNSYVAIVTGVGAPIVSGNVFTDGIADSDADMGPNGRAGWTAVIVNAAGVPVATPAGLTFPGNGTFSYNTANGPLTFYYLIDTGSWTDGTATESMSADSNVAKVTITLTAP
jgi:hypothetical protein